MHNYKIKYHSCKLFLKLAHNDRGYGHLPVSVARNVPFAGAFAVVELQGKCGCKTFYMHVNQHVPICVWCFVFLFKSLLYI